MRISYRPLCLVLVTEATHSAQEIIIYLWAGLFHQFQCSLGSLLAVTIHPVHVCPCTLSEPSRKGQPCNDAGERKTPALSAASVPWMFLRGFLPCVNQMGLWARTSWVPAKPLPVSTLNFIQNNTKNEVVDITPKATACEVIYHQKKCEEC